MTDSTETIETENVVAATGIERELNLEQAGDGLPAADYNPEQFPGRVYRTQEPNVAAFIFGSGKGVITGAKATDAVTHAANAVETRHTDLGLFGR